VLRRSLLVSGGGEGAVPVLRRSLLGSGGGEGAPAALHSAPVAGGGDCARARRARLGSGDHASPWLYMQMIYSLCIFSNLRYLGVLFS
jgi:hypothetical protein